MYSSNPIILQLLSLLKEFGIRKIVVSPGGRHVQLILSLEQDPDFELFSVVDERSAAFFALGLIQSYNEPVAVACTSGTACINYGSALVEALYQRLPLLVLSADRLPAYLNQGEEQMYNQLSPFKEITKYQVQLPDVKTPLDLWHCNRLINEALNELTIHGRGPVQINFPIETIFGQGFTEESLPKVRKINVHIGHADWCFFRTYLSEKRILIVWGQSVDRLKEVGKAVEKFCEHYNACVITDCISNCPLPSAIRNTFVVLQTLSPDQRHEIVPDVVIFIGGSQSFSAELKGILKSNNFESWQVGSENKVCDSLHTLTQMFEMTESQFFNGLCEDEKKDVYKSYFNLWKSLSDLPLPNMNVYNEVSVIGRLMTSLPANSSLQLANSNTIRIANCFPTPEDIKVFCNRGANGIDGSMSTAIGYACTQEHPVFYITGELSFFYDMNSLSIRHVTPNLRILLINNEGGAFMYSNRRVINGKPSLTLAAANSLTAKGWIESLGFEYLYASDMKEYEEGLQRLLVSESEKPIILEVKTDMAKDRQALDNYINSLDRRTFLDKVKGRVERSKFNFLKK